MCWRLSVESQFRNPLHFARYAGVCCATSDDKDGKWANQSPSQRRNMRARHYGLMAEQAELQSGGAGSVREGNPFLEDRQQQRSEPVAAHRNVGTSWTDEDGQIHVGPSPSPPDDPSNQQEDASGFRITVGSIRPEQLWVAIEFADEPQSEAVDMLDVLLDSWFACGRIGGFNMANLQVVDQLYFKPLVKLEQKLGSFTDLNSIAAMPTPTLTYDEDQARRTSPSFFHDKTALQKEGATCRFCVDIGQMNLVGVDVLINMLLGFHREVLQIKTVVLGDAKVAGPPGSSAQQASVEDPFGYIDKIRQQLST